MAKKIRDEKVVDVSGVSMEESIAADMDQAVQVAEDGPDSAVEVNSEDQRNIGLKEETGTLMLRFFNKDPRTGKMLTRLRRKVYFPVNTNIDSGWYLATITEIHNNYGVMDTMPLATLPVEMWKPEYIKGIFIKKNFQDACLEIYPSIPKKLLDEQEPTLIYKVPFQVSPKKQSGATIAEIIAAKRAEAEAKN